MNPLSYLAVPLFQKAFLACLLSGAGLSLVGLVVIHLQLTTIRFALMHVALLGAAMAMLFGASPLIGALAGIVVASLFLGPAGDFIKIDMGITGAVFMTGSLGLAFLLFHRAGVRAMDAFALFTGSVLALENADLWAIGIASVMIWVVFIVFYREIQMVLYDPQVAESLGVPVKRIRNGLLLLTGLAIGISMRLVGALLVDAAVLLPAIAALALARSLRGALLLAACFGILSQVGGLAASMLWDMPSGAAITLTAIVVLVLAGLWARMVRRVV